MDPKPRGSLGIVGDFLVGILITSFQKKYEILKVVKKKCLVKMSCKTLWRQLKDKKDYQRLISKRRINYDQTTKKARNPWKSRLSGFIFLAGDERIELKTKKFENSIFAWIFNIFILLIFEVLVFYHVLLCSISNNYGGITHIIYDICLSIPLPQALAEWGFTDSSST